MIKNYEQVKISGWGGYPIRKAKVIYPKYFDQIQNEIKKITRRKRQSLWR